MGTDDLDFLRELEHELGEIKVVAQECSGIYYLSVCDRITSVLREFYVVAPDAAIPAAARAYGQSSLSRPELLLFPFEEKRGGRYILDYEICKYKLQNNIKMPAGTSLHNLAVFGREHCPSFFGPFPVPTVTPWGFTLRYRALDHGIHWIETEWCRLVLSICYPICDELSDQARRLAKQTPYDLKYGIDNTLGCLFFSKEASCVPIWELMETRGDWSASGKINKEALMNAILNDQTEYALRHNLHEQQGSHDLAGRLLNSLGADVELQGSAENMIVFTESAGTEFYQF